MRQVICNRFIELLKFRSHKEISTFISNQTISSILLLEESFGDIYYCYAGYHSLTNQKQFIISFNSDEDESNLHLLFWLSAELLVIETGRMIYCIDNKLSIKYHFDFITPLLGLYVTNTNNLLILDCMSIKIVTPQGVIVQDDSFDLIEDFSITGSYLSIKTSEGSKKFSLL
ncbi:MULTISPECIES: hypothetical protein [Candidatus Cardinium]|uniref:hypothetical protein n=1 Tax=Candidatus Cardinium TaxID=273135 RepID=UPI001FA969BE|nr:MULTISPECIES: hypothetical protein [Cardinium]